MSFKPSSEKGGLELSDSRKSENVRMTQVYSNAITSGLNDVESSFVGISGGGNENSYTKSESMPLTSNKDAMDHEDDDHVVQRPRSNCVQILTVVMVTLLFAMIVVVISVTSATFDKLGNLPSNKYVTTVYQSLGLPGYEGYSWNDVVSGASGHNVNFWTYNAPKYNSWIDNWLTPRLLELYNIKLVRYPLSATTEAVNKVISESSKGVKNGSVDLIWMNGVNFANLKSKNLVYGPWSTKVPNAANFDFNSAAIEYDFGVPINGYEMPYNEAQCIFIYNNQTVSSTSVSSIDKILNWITSNPNKFTYAAPSTDYTGSAFIRHIFYSIADPYTQFLGSSFNENLYLKYAPTFYSKLRSLEPYLYNYTVSGVVYPSSNSVVDDLFGTEDVLLTLSYDVGHATSQVIKGLWSSEITASLVLSSGTIANTNYITVPSNAANKLAAIVAGNFIASAQAMFSRAQPEEIGALQAYNPSCDTFTAGGWEDAFEYIDRADTTPTTASLFNYRLGELSNDYVTRIQSDWYNCVLYYQTIGKNTPSTCG